MTSTRIDATSYRARTRSGRSTMRLTSVGAMNVDVHRWRSIVRSASSGSNLRITTTVPPKAWVNWAKLPRSEEHTSELQSQSNLVCRLLLEKKKKHNKTCSRHSSACVEAA